MTDAMAISTIDGGMVSLIAPDAARSDTSSPSFMPRLRISGNRTGATAAMSAVFEPGNAGHEQHRAEQDVRHAGPNMSEQRSQECDHHPRHAGRIDKLPEQHEERYGEQDQRAHAFIHPPDHDA